LNHVSGKSVREHCRSNAIWKKPNYQRNHAVPDM